MLVQTRAQTKNLIELCRNLVKLDLPLFRLPRKIIHYFLFEGKPSFDIDSKNKFNGNLSDSQVLLSRIILLIDSSMLHE